MNCYEEAINELKVEYLGEWKHERKAKRLAIEALEKAEKYKWHDLIKNPDDLPPAEMEVDVAIRQKISGKQIRTHAIYEDGTILECDSIWDWYDIDGEYNEEENCCYVPKSWWEDNYYLHEDNSRIYDDVIAWKFIEPFEGDNEE